MNLEKKRTGAKSSLVLTFAFCLLLGALTLFGCATFSICGDEICSQNETVQSCAKDCSRCGDGYCIGSETVKNCSLDCSSCGDNNCTGPETMLTCPQDCPDLKNSTPEKTSPNQVDEYPADNFSPGDKIITTLAIPLINASLSSEEIILLENSGYKYLVKECLLYNAEGTIQGIDNNKKTLPIGSYGAISKIEKTNDRNYIYSEWRSADGNIIGYGAIDDTNGCLSDYAQIIPAGTKGNLLESVPSQAKGTQPSYINTQNYWLALLILNEEKKETVWVPENAIEKN